MSHKVVSEEELKLLMSPDSDKEAKDQPKYPKLTMKFLYGLITELQQENALLIKRVSELEHQLAEFYQVQGEVAATAELPVPEETSMMAGMNTNLYPDIPHVIRVSRSERHPAPKKKSFWSACALWFRPSPYRQHR
jgi:hypothetical protein